MTPLRDEVIAYLRTIFGTKSPLDVFVEGIDDPKFDPDKPYRGDPNKGREPFMDSEHAEMMVEMMTQSLSSVSRWTDYTMEDAFIVTKLRLSPTRKTYDIKVA